MPGIHGQQNVQNNRACHQQHQRSATVQHQQQQEQGASPGCPRLLPVLAWHEILSHLDQLSRTQLKLADKLFCSLINTTMTQLSLSACDLKSTDLEVLAGETPAASSLCITAPRRRISLSRLNHRRRCEQHLALFLDNVSPWPNLTALDISTAVTYISCPTLHLLVDSLPHLQQLSLPPVATCRGTEAEALYALGQLHCLCSADLDCSLFQESSSSSLQSGGLVQQQDLDNVSNQQPQQHTALQSLYSAQADLSAPIAQQDDPGGLLPLQHEAHPAAVQLEKPGYSSSYLTHDDLQLHKLASSYATPANDSHGALQANSSRTGHPHSAAHSTISTSSCTGPYVPHARPWFGLHSLKKLQHLQLQHVRPGCVPDALLAVGQMQDLVSLSITGLSQAAANLVLGRVHSPSTAAHAVTAPGANAAAEDGSQGQWLLSRLQDLPKLARLEVGLDTSLTEGSSTSSGQHPGLIIPAHSGSAAAHAAGASDALECGWSCLRSVQELILDGICLDSTLMAATLDCQQLTALRVGALDLRQDVRAVAVAGSGAGFRGLQCLRVLQVDQYFSLGCNDAAVLMPALESLKVTHAGSRSPDLSSLEHQQHLSSLDITVPLGSCWSLHTLQLGHLVHLTALKDLRLAECCSTDSSTRATSGGTTSSSSSSAGGRGGFSRRCPRGHQTCSKSSSHWLPSCTGSLSQVTSLELCGPVTDHALGQLPGQFPGLMRLTVDSSYFASDGGLQKLNCAPHLQLLVLRNCRHITDFGLEEVLMGGGVRVVAVQSCAGIDERACHRIRKACRYSGAQLLWYGSCGTTVSSSSRSAHSQSTSCLHDTGTTGQCCSKSSSTGRIDSSSSSSVESFSTSSSGSAFLRRCWQQQQGVSSGCAKSGQQPVHQGSTSAVVAAATAVWQDSGCTQVAPSPVGPAQSSASQTWRPNSHAASPSCPPPRRVSGGCVPAAGVRGREEPWNQNPWGGGWHALAH